MNRLCAACLCVVAVVCAGRWIVADESDLRTAAAASQNAPAATRCLVELNEYQWKQRLPAGLGPEELLALVLKPDAEPPAELHETIRLSSLGGTESMVQFGRRSSVTVGRAVTGRGEVLKNLQSVEYGTLVKLTAVPQQQQILLSLSFESSRPLPATADDAPADVSQTRISTALLLDPGKPALVSSFDGNPGSVLVVTVRSIP
ncbi:MAG: hypothetical protein ACKON9_14475 [Planctomycetaceae bacterium]